MKNQTKNFAALTLGLLAALALPAPAQVTPEDTVTAVPTVTLTNAQTLTVTSNAFRIYDGKGFGLFITGTTTNNATGNVIAAIRYSYDGATWSGTSRTASNAIAASATTRSYISIPPDDVRGAKWGSIVSLKNEHTNSITASVIISR